MRAIIYKVILSVSLTVYFVISLSVSETGLRFSDMFSSFSEEWVSQFLRDTLIFVE